MAQLRSTGLRRGVFGGSRGWFVVWAGLTLVKVLRRASARERETVWTGEISPGESLLIRHRTDTRAELGRVD